MDDDGAFVSQSTIVDVRNKPPVAEITVLNQSGPESLIITTGDSLNFSATNSSDSTSDLPSLRYLWDHDGIDGNGDGDLSNDIDHEGIDYSPEFNRLGTFTVTLTVVDDDGERDIVFIEVLVEAQPEEGLLGGFLSGEGSSTNIAIGSLLLIFVALLIVVLLRRDDSEPVGPVDWNLPEAGGLLATTEKVLPVLDTPAPLYEAPVAIAEPEPIFTPEPTAATSGPTLPAAGVIVAKPATIPVTIPNTDGFPWRIHSMVIQASDPQAALKWVTNIAIAALLSAASADPALKPNQPTQSMPAPVTVIVRLWGGIAVAPNPLRGPIIIAATSAATPAVM